MKPLAKPGARCVAAGVPVFCKDSICRLYPEFAAYRQLPWAKGGVVVIH